MKTILLSILDNEKCLGCGRKLKKCKCGYGS